MSGLRPDGDISTNHINDYDVKTIYVFTESNPFYFIFTHKASVAERSNQSDNFNASLVTPNETDREGIQYPPEMIAFGGISMLLLSTVAIMGNFISILALSRSKRLKKLTTAFVVNLCVADFFLSVCYFTNSINVVSTQHWNGGDETCKFHDYFIFFFALLAMYTVAAITLNRYILIVHPRFYHTMFTKRNTVIMIGMVWAVCTTFIMLAYYKVWGKFGFDPSSGECSVIDDESNTHGYIFILAYFTPLVLFIVCYAKIFYVVRKTERKTSSHKGNILSYLIHLCDSYWHDEKENEITRTKHEKLRNKKEWRLFQMISVIFFCFVLCFIPMSVMKMLRKEKEHPSLYVFCHLGMHLSYVINPVIYIVMSEEYRKSYTDLFRCGNAKR